MIFPIVLFLLNTFSLLFVVYKSINYMHLSQKQSLPKEQSSYLITSWILFLVFSSLKCSCSGAMGTIWNLLVQLGLLFSLLNTKVANKKIFEENTFETLMAFANGLYEKYAPKKKSE